MRLTKRSVEGIAPSTRDQYLWDGDLKGFGVKVTPAGRRGYLLQYRMGGREASTRRWTIGAHGSPWTADTARAEAIRIQTLIRQGIDPRVAEQRRRDEAVTLEFNSYVELFIERYLKVRWKHGWADGARLLRDVAVPKWRGRPISELTRRDVTALLDTVDDRPATARLLFATLRKLFNWALERGDIAISPLAGMKGPPSPVARDRVLNDEELAAVWMAAGSLGWPFGTIVRLLIATGARRGEVAGLDWREVDLEAGEWLLPKERSKNGSSHLKPLNATALAILKEMPAQRKGLMFSSTGTSMPSGFSKAKARLDVEVVQVLRKWRKTAEDVPASDIIAAWRIHDLRRTVATNLQRLGVRFEVIEAVQNRLSGSRSGVAGIYQRHTWVTEKLEAAQLWDEKLKAVVSANDSGANG